MGFVDKHDDKGRVTNNSSQHASLSNDEANHAGSFFIGTASESGRIASLYDRAAS